MAPAIASSLFIWKPVSPFGRPKIQDPRPQCRDPPTKTCDYRRLPLSGVLSLGDQQIFVSCPRLWVLYFLFFFRRPRDTHGDMETWRLEDGEPKPKPRPPPARSNIRFMIAVERATLTPASYLISYLAPIIGDVCQSGTQ